MNNHRKSIINMMLRRSRRFAMWALMGMPLTAVFGQMYAVVDLGDYSDTSGQTLSGPRAINRTGQIAGINVIGGSYQALVYGGSWTNLGTLGGADSYAAGINNLARIAGYSSFDSTGSHHAFLWTPGGTGGVPGNVQMQDLGTLGGSLSEGYAINPGGQITGYAQTAQNDRAFVYSGGAMTDIGARLGGSLPNSYGYSINDSGHVTGTAYNSAYIVAHAFFYDGTKAVDIGSLSSQGANGLAINNNDQITGYSTVSGGFDHAFRYANGLLIDLGTLGGSYSYGNGINNSNVIVGGSFTDASNSIYHAFVSAGNSIADLNTNIDSSGTGWVLVEARGINDVGQIVGVGTFGGVNHDFLLNPLPQITKQEPVITDFRVAGRNIIIGFLTINTGSYSVQASSTPTGGWTDVLTGIPGTGGTVTATNIGGASFVTRFFRVKLGLP